MLPFRVRIDEGTKGALQQGPNFELPNGITNFENKKKIEFGCGVVGRLMWVGVSQGSLLNKPIVTDMIKSVF